MAVAERVGEYVVPVAVAEPPVSESYQLTVPAEDVAPNVTAPGPQRAAGVTPVMAGIVLTVAVMAVLVAVVHVPAVAST